ncbi:MAG: hypothetical protein ACXVBU_01490 [Ktedonobacteraceae bacterium]
MPRAVLEPYTTNVGIRSSNTNWRLRRPGLSLTIPCLPIVLKILTNTLRHVKIMHTENQYLPGAVAKW